MHKTGSSPSSTGASSDAEAARKAKRAMAETLGLDEPFIDAMVERFYGMIREDGLLGPIFEARIADWPAHLAQMKRFWRSILHSSGEYSGAPMRKHIVIEGLEEAHFNRWLNLFYRNLRDLGLSGEGGRVVGDRARAIADSFLTGIAVQRFGISGVKAGGNLPHF
ncbi:group III truncated hemoglobin [Altericroceibacterium spongiae]|uniref:Group III truncated hemoglobin n=1 Tax=Altericroceibacterium spongiae TaxID=2320269 RepID=A0A420EFG5_9SPHN|nr:group III truncated hemoglobin [Altericroceibacterium spongiae]